jgi:hypothetical protein
MSISTLVQCSVCGAQKGITNHWFMSKVVKGALQIRPFNLRDALDLDYKPLCGERCVTKEVSTNLSRLVMDQSPAPSFGLSPLESVFDKFFRHDKLTYA